MESLFLHNYRPLCLFALHYLNDTDAAEDVVQECFATLWEKINSGNVVINRKAYLYMTVRNRCLDQEWPSDRTAETLRYLWNHR